MFKLCLLILCFPRTVREDSVLAHDAVDASITLLPLFR
jgi:hypothetical protein